MDLILWRHADAEDGVPDASRALTVKGRKQAEAMGAWLKHHVQAPVSVLASPAVRAQQTARAYVEDFRTREELAPEASAARMLETAGWPSASGTVILVGHQPALGAAAALALTGKASAWPIKKGAIWWLRTDDRGAPLVVAVITPKLARASRTTS